MSNIIQLTLLFFLGTCIGSFINVLYWRLPRNESIVYTRSHCTNCNKIIPWYLNIPILSWLYLKGRCNKCNEKISFRYPLIELFSGILFVLSYFSYPSTFINIGTSKIFIITGGIILYSLLFTISIIDIKTLWIPSSLSKFGIITALFYTSIISVLTRSKIIFIHIFSSLICLIFLIAISYLANRIFKKKALGTGDIKLFFLLALWLSWPGIGITMYLSFLFSGIFVIVGLLMRKIKKGNYIPFAPFISVSASLTWLLGNDFWINIYISTVNYLN